MVLPQGQLRIPKLSYIRYKSLEMIIMVEETAKKSDQSRRIVEVTQVDLPLSCPLPQDEVWNMHPRVYLPVEQGGEAACPYCGTRYVLRD